MMYDRKDKSYDKDETRTPPELYRKLDDRFHFDLDVCCTPENCLSRYGYGYSKEDNALERDWSRFMMDNGEEATTFYCNPPYSNPEPFIAKAYEESIKGCTVVMLLNADTSTKAFHYYCMKASEIIFLEGRVKHLKPDGSAIPSSSPFGSMVVVFKPEEFDGSPIISSMRWKD